MRPGDRRRPAYREADRRGLAIVYQVDERLRRGRCEHDARRGAHRGGGVGPGPGLRGNRHGTARGRGRLRREVPLAYLERSGGAGVQQYTGDLRRG